MQVPATILRAARAAAQTYGVDLALLLAIGHAESAGWTRRIGDITKGLSLGYWQINLNGAGLSYRDNPDKLLETPTNAMVAADYLRACHDAYPDDEARVIAAYNAGVTGVSGTGWRQVNWDSYVVPVQAKLALYRVRPIDEDWDANVAAGFQGYGKTWLDVAATLLGVCNDALPAGRRLRDELLAIRERANAAVATWGSR
ncbi:MAG: transglycosylase SLT domain-containing protein [Pseudomonadota bacterium]